MNLRDTIFDAKKSIEDCDVIVCGGGITGLTTAVALQSMGFSVAMIAESSPIKGLRDPRSPFIPTDYAMASAYPHFLQVEDLEAISECSQKVFDHLSSISGCGVDRYRIFEVFEEEPPAAALGERRMAFETFDGRPQMLSRTIKPPVRTGADYLWGYVFESFFADMPTYLAFLWNLFQQSGGRFEELQLTHESIVELSGGRPVFDCLGLGAVDVFQDSAPRSIVRGRQVVVSEAPLCRSEDGLPLAYNYTPLAEHYGRFDGRPEYLHFFPRPDGWILGQTREAGKLDENGVWHGEAVVAEEIEIEGGRTFRPIVDLNEDIIGRWTGEALLRDRMKAREGYRFYRDPTASGVRLEIENIDGVPVIHNYGHGGSGITMSWGCSMRSIAFLLREVGRSSQKQNSKLGVLLTRFLPVS